MINKKMKYIASVSFGKDSLAMLLLLIERKWPLNEVVFYDTGMEFSAIYHIKDKIKPMLDNLGIKFTELKPSMPFTDKMYNYWHKAKDGTLKWGYGWCGGLCRWGTTEKLTALNKYCKGATQYVGIAADETKRLERLKIEGKISPLSQMGFTEKMCLNYCRSRGFNWKEGDIDLYDILSRVSCWCCRNKNLKELKNYKEYLPNYYKRLKALEIVIGEPMKKPYTLKERFDKNDSKN